MNTSMNKCSYRCQLFDGTQKDNYTSIKVPDKFQKILGIIRKWILATDQTILLQERLQK